MDTATSRKFTAEEIDTWLIDLIAEYYQVESAGLGRETNFVSDLGTDSLDSMEILMSIEEHFDINFGDDIDLKETSTIAMVSNAVKERLATKG